MYLKSLEMIGFKSFADKTKLEFEPGMTAIVGPNGCGKSNISDALRWVLGEQSAKALRGAAMVDVIFNGTDTRKPLNMAEVSVTFADCTTALNLEFSEITITRRVFRTGEGQYFINKAPCRLKDIGRLFMDTGVGTTSYSVLEQGRIDQILSSRPEDRREVFEEASGITKFKNDKKEALRKLEHTEANLVRLADVIREVKRQIVSLQRQAGKARRFQALRDQLRGADLYVTRGRLKSLDEEIAAIQSRLTSLGETLHATQREVEELEEGNTVLRQAVVHTEQEIGHARERAVQAEGRLEHTRELIKVNREQIGQYTGMIERDRREIENGHRQLETARTGHEQFTREVASLGQVEREAALAAEAGAARFAEHQARMDVARQSLQTLRTDLLQLEGQASRLQNEYAELDNHERAQVLERERLAAERGHIARSAAELQTRQEETGRILETLRAEVQFRQQQAAELEQQRRGIEDRIQAQSRRQADLQSAHAASEARIDVLRERHTPADGMPGGTRQLLDSANPLAIESGWLLGTLVAHLEVDDPFLRALEVSLRTCIDAVVVRDMAAAREIVARVRSCGAGSVRMLTVPPAAPVPAPAPDGAVSLLDHVRCPEAIRTVVHTLLSHVYVVPSADAIPPHVPSNTVYVTQDGMLIHGDGWVEYCAPDDGAANPLQSRQALSEAEVESRQLLADLQSAGDEVDRLRQSVVAIDAPLVEARAHLEKSTRALVQKEAEHALISGSVQESSKKLETVTWELDTLKNRNVSADTDKARIEEQLRDLRSRREQLAEATATANRDLQQSESRNAELQNELSNLRIRHGEVTQSLRAAESRLEAATARIAELEQHVGERTAAIQESESRVQSLDHAVCTAEASLSTLEHAVRQEHDQVESLQRNRTKQAAELEQMEAAVAKKRAALEELHAGKSDLDVTFTEKRMRRQNELDRLLNEYRVTPEQLETEPEPQWEGERPAPEALDTYVAELRTKLEAMGPVNLVAIEEYKELEERHAFLTQQEQDLVNSKQQLMEMIRKINRTTTDLFRSTFEKANTNFQIMFEKLFNGGSAKLVLVNEEDILECGIEIIARPPGKRLQNVSLLSGGERTLTAVALLFAIYMIKPSPFCMLDELDAALDEANINRFVTVLQDFLQQSQFVVITHNRKTIAAARVLYGVTMHEKGISGIVSMKFNEAKQPEPAPAG